MWRIANDFMLSMMIRYSVDACMKESITASCAGNSINQSDRVELEKFTRQIDEHILEITMKTVYSKLTIRSLKSVRASVINHVEKEIYTSGCAFSEVRRGTTE